MEVEKVVAKKISLDSIVFDPNQPRKSFVPQKIIELGESIVEQGQIDPILAAPIPNSKPVKYMLIAGERRTRAHRENEILAKRGTIKAEIYYGLSEKKRVLMQMAENELRENVNILERIASWIRFLHKEKLGSVEDLAKAHGRTPESIRRDLCLINLTPDMREKVNEGKLKLDAARKIGKVADDYSPEKMQTAFNLAVKANKGSQQATNVETYIASLNQDTIIEGGKATTDKDTLKQAGAILSGFMNSAGKFNTNKTDRYLMIRGRSKQVKEGKISLFVNELRKIADGIPKAEENYKAQNPALQNAVAK